MSVTGRWSFRASSRQERNKTGSLVRAWFFFPLALCFGVSSPPVSGRGARFSGSGLYD